MHDTYIEDREFKNEDFTQQMLHVANYEYCRFVGCNFSECDLSEFAFLECEFENCNLGMVNLTDSSLREIKFKNCKMVGVDFSVCEKLLFEVDFEGCHLDYASFHKLKLKSRAFAKCSLKEAYFAEADLSKSTLDECDLQGAIFEFTNLEEANLTTSINYTINPENNRIKKARFSISGLPGLLTSYEIVVE